MASTFLLVEDSNADAALIRRAFTRANLLNPLQVVISGEQALAYLSGRGHYADRSRYPLPEIVLLDLNLPGIDGFEVLSWIRMQPQLRTVRVLILTSSDDPRHVTRARQLGADAYLVKPDDLNEFASFAAALGGTWEWNSEFSAEPVRSTPAG